MEEALFIATVKVSFGSYNAGERIALTAQQAAAMVIENVIELSDDDMKTLASAIAAHRARQRTLLPVNAEVRWNLDGSVDLSANGRAIPWERGRWSG
jgi:hypothetical protein